MLAATRISQDAERLSSLENDLHCRVRVMSVPVGQGLAAKNLDHFESMLACVGIEVGPSKLITD